MMNFLTKIHKKNSLKFYLIKKHSIKNYSSILTSEIKKFSEIPGPLRLPFIGNTYLYKLGIYNVFQYHKVLEKLYTKYGNIVREDVGTRCIIHVFHPDDVKKVLNSEGKMPEVPPLQETTQLYRKNRNLSLGLGNTNGEEWYRLRSAVQQMMMRPKEVYHYLPFADSVAMSFVEKISQNLNSSGLLKTDLRNLVAKWSLESAGMTCFERSLGCFGPNEKLAEEMIEANKNIFVIGGILKYSLPIYKYFKTPKWKKFLDSEDFFYSNATKFVEETIDKINSLVKEGKFKDGQYNFLSFLLSSKELDRKDVTIITLSLFGDGLSTTAPTLIYNLYCLAKNPCIQEKVYKEISTNVPKDKIMTVDIMNNLQYLKAAVKEAFRFYPIGTETSRVTGSDLVLGNYQIPSGMHVDLNQFVYFKSEKYFKNPLEFSPERWLRDQQVVAQSPTVHPFLLTPFGHGTRMCAGRRFAEQDLYTSLSRILLTYRLELVDPNEKLEQVYNTLLFPQTNPKLIFIKR